MNLTKLFNFHYLYENIKKSKMPIILCLLVVPLFTIIMLLTSGTEVYTFASLGIFNIIFMYVIPFILSANLFGYVYKKKSVDFIGSMPLSRKTIFFTNTLAGILLIIIMQAMTLLCTLIISTFSSSIIFAGLAWDVFLYQTIAYIFIFTIANLAMSVSGNIMTQIVGVLLITFLVPALYTFTYYAAGDQIADMIAEHTSISPIAHFDTLTAPSLILSGLEGGGYGYNVISMIKMVILSIIYMGVGYVFFQKRKMEKAGESFVKNSTHFYIKALTLLPFMMIVKAIFMTEEWEPLPFILAIILVYWFVYDLITSKKMKFLQNFGILLASMAILFAILSGIIWTYSTIWNGKIKIENIAKLELSDSWYPHKMDVSQKYVIKDQELITSIVDNNRYYTEKDYEKEEALPTYMFGTMTMKNGRKYEINVTVDAKDLAKVHECKEKHYDIPQNKNIKVYMDDRIASREDKKELIKILKETTPYEVRNYDGYYYVMEYLPESTVRIVRKTDSYFNVSAYEYIHHELYVYRYRETKELMELLVNINNKAAIEQIKNARPYDIYYDVRDNKADYMTYSSTEIKTKLKQFVLDHKDNKVDLNKDYICILLNITSITPNLRVVYTTNEVSKVIENFTERMFEEDFEEDFEKEF